jgi:hypothetical protein
MRVVDVVMHLLQGDGRVTIGFRAGSEGETVMKTMINKTLIVVAAFGMGEGFQSRAKAEPPPDFVNSTLRSQRSQQQVAEAPKGQQPKTKQQCPGCGGKFITKDVPAGQGGRLSVFEYVRTWSTCSDCALRCVAKPGSAATKGMEKTFEIAPVK